MSQGRRLNGMRELQGRYQVLSSVSSTLDHDGSETDGAHTASGGLA